MIQRGLKKPSVYASITDYANSTYSFFYNISSSEWITNSGKSLLASTSLVMLLCSILSQNDRWCVTNTNKSIRW
jgi:hypothetical protein